MFARAEKSFNSADDLGVASEPSHLSQVESLAELNEKVSNRYAQHNAESLTAREI